MKLRFSVFVLLFCVGFSRLAFGWASQPDYRLQNRLPEPILVEFINREGKPTKVATVLPGRELALPARQCRFVVHTNTQAREYVVPTILDVPRTPIKSAPAYEPMVNGKWRLIVTEASTLGIAFLGGGTVQEPIPNFTKPPLLFPLRARRPSETFEHYQADLHARVHSTLAKNPE
ncbi:MAG: hypothetical protein QM796_16485 [Chthoniobacteraceae bacterium]